MAGQTREVNIKEKEGEKPKKEKKKSKSESCIEALRGALSPLAPEEQVAAIIAKYAELLEENKQLQACHRAAEKRAESAIREKDKLEHEHSKVILTRSRLESLCRELQRQNKCIKDENLSRLHEEEERRKEVSKKFNTTLTEISNLMEENTERNTKLREENQQMGARLRELIIQYEDREKTVEKIIEQKQLQAQLAEAKLAKSHIEFNEQKEKLLTEKKQLLEQLSEYQEKMTKMSMVEIGLRTQLGSYAEKYEDFQTTLDRSNQIFTNFKKDMEEMTKKVRRMEKETRQWKERCDGSNKALLEMVQKNAALETDRDTVSAALAATEKKMHKLQELCRAMQQENTSLRVQLRTKGDDLQKLNPGESLVDSIASGYDSQTSCEIELKEPGDVVLEHVPCDTNVPSGECPECVLEQNGVQDGSPEEARGDVCEEALEEEETRAVSSSEDPGNEDAEAT